MPSCDGVLKIRAIFNFGPQQELLRIRGNPRSRPECGSGFAKFGFSIGYRLSRIRPLIFDFRPSGSFPFPRGLLRRSPLTHSIEAL